MKIKLNVISGNLKSRRIEVSKNQGMRPMLTRARSTLFNTLFNIMDLKGKTILDICCGSGLLGIESLSRGAKKAFFFDIDRKICEELKSNLELLNLSSCTEVNCSNIFYIKKNKEEKPANLVFIDLPYKSSYLIKKIMKKLYINNWIDGHTVFLLAISKSTKISLEEYNLIKEKTVSQTRLLFVTLKEENFKENQKEGGEEE